MNIDDKIGAILRAEADAVEPSAAGWNAINDGIAARRRRAWWGRGAALAGAVATVVAVVAFVATDGSPRGIEQVPTTQTPGETASGSPSASPSATPDGPAFVDEPIDAIWPLTTTAEVRDWEADHGQYPALETQVGAALAFGRRYLGLPDSTVTNNTPGTYGVWNDKHLVSTLTVEGFGDERGAPYVVTRADGGDLHIAAPAPGAPLSKAVTARGSYEAVDPSFTVTLLADTGGVTPVEVATAHATTGPDGWTADLTFTTSARTGSLLVTNPSLRDGTTASAAAIPVVFGSIAQGPRTVVAARDGRVAVLSAADGSVVRWLTEAQPGGGAYDPALSEDGKTVVYAQGAGTCSAEIRSVPFAGGDSKTLVGGGEGALSRPALRGTTLAYVRTLCQSGGDKQEVVIKYGSQPFTEPVTGTVVGGLAIGDRFLAYASRSGTTTTLHLPDLTNELADAPTPAPTGCAWTATAWGPVDANDRQQLFAGASCSDQDEVVEDRVYRMDADGRNLGRFATLDVLGLRWLDWSGEYLLVGAQDTKGGQRAYTYVAGTLTAIPGEAQRPTW